MSDGRKTDRDVGKVGIGGGGATLGNLTPPPPSGEIGRKRRRKLFSSLSLQSCLDRRRWLVGVGPPLHCAAGWGGWATFRHIFSSNFSPLRSSFRCVRTGAPLRKSQKRHEVGNEGETCPFKRTGCAGRTMLCKRTARSGGEGLPAFCGLFYLKARLRHLFYRPRLRT